MSAPPGHQAQELALQRIGDRALQHQSGDGRGPPHRLEREQRSDRPVSGTGTASIHVIDAAGKVRFSYRNEFMYSLRPSGVVDVAGQYGSSYPTPSMPVDAQGNVFLDFDPGLDHSHFKSLEFTCEVDEFKSACSRPSRCVRPTPIGRWSPARQSSTWTPD